jgi:hypothetical protein
MFKYVRDMRMTALKHLYKSFSKGNRKISLRKIVMILMFEDNDDCMSFLEHCGYVVELGSKKEGQMVILCDPEENLPLDANDNKVLPPVTKMEWFIEGIRNVGIRAVDKSTR